MSSMGNCTPGSYISGQNMNPNGVSLPVGSTGSTANIGDVSTLLATTEFVAFAGNPLFSVIWWPNRAAIPSGYVPADGQTLQRVLYPAAYAGIAAGNVPTNTDANWLSTPTERGKYTLGDGVNTFRVPDYNGKYAGSLGAAFLRGDGGRSAGTDGVIQQDAFQGHAHSPGIKSGAATGAGFTTLANQVGGTPGSDPVTGPPISDGTNGTPRTASETRPLNVTGCWIIKIFGAVINPGSADAAALATAVAGLQSSKQDVSSVFGTGQTWQDVTGNRVVGTIYYNTTSKPILIHVSGNQTTSGGVGAFNISVSGITIQGQTSYGSSVRFFNLALIPAGASYTVSFVGSTWNNLSWIELR